MDGQAGGAGATTAVPLPPECSCGGVAIQARRQELLTLPFHHQEPVVGKPDRWAARGWDGGLALLVHVAGGWTA